MSKHKIVVLGAGYSGLRAVFRMAGKINPIHSEITLINAAPNFMERIRFHQHAVGQVTKTISIEKLLRGKNVRFVQAYVTHIDVHAHMITVKAGEQTQNIAYDTLLYALGSTIDRDSVLGVREYAHVLSMEGKQQLQARLQQLPNNARVLVCGGGLTGLEMASELAETYPKMRVQLVTRGKFGADLSQKGREYLKKVFNQYNIDVQEGVTVNEIKADRVVADNREIPFDVCVWTGAFSVPTLAREAGIVTNERGQIVVDEMLRSTSHPNIFAAGDAAYAPMHPVMVRMSCQSALPMGMSAAENIAHMLKGEPLKPFNMGFVLQGISLGRRNGLIQRVRLDDTPVEQVYTGRLGAWIKEMVCLMTRITLYAERNRLWINTTPQPNWAKLKGRIPAPQLKSATHGHIADA